VRKSQWRNNRSLCVPGVVISGRHQGDGKARHELGRRRRSVNPGTEPSPACLLPKVSQIERGLDDTTQGALYVGTECRATFVSEGTLPACPVPSPVLVTWWSIHSQEVTTSFHGIAESLGTVRVVFGSGKGSVTTYRYELYLSKFCCVVTIL